MKKEYDFSHGKRGPVVPAPPGKVRLTIRLDAEILDWFWNKVNEQGGGNYQTMINEALRAHIQQQDKTLEETLRRVIREELRAQG
jgi:uncharacterized protein (DUF4415 family)|uniref:CopG family transcriptional regulator n=1 Tax=Desulfobacca acetoxidans TaxID=60893 RepID=A0A7C3UZX3_9BACT